MKKWWSWPWPFRGALSDLEYHQGCSAEQYKSSTDASPLLERGNLLDLEMLDVARKDSMTPAPAERVLSLRPRAEEPIGAPAHNKPLTLESEEASQSEELAFMQRVRLSAPPGFILSCVNEYDLSP